MIDGGVIAAAIAGGAGILGTVGLIARRWSRDRLEIAKDRAEINIIAEMIQQRDDARNERDKAQAELNKLADENHAAMTTIRELTAKVEQSSARAAMLEHLTKRLTKALDQATENLEAALINEETPGS